MTNEEKAKELLDTGVICSGQWGECLPDCIKCNKYNYMLMMAQWKDKCFNEVIEHLRETYQLDEQVMFILKLVESRYNDKMK